MAFYGPVPGDLGYPNGGTDFNDCASMFCRTVVEGLFGYRPDYPNGVVTDRAAVAGRLGPRLDQDARFLAWTSAATKYRIELAQPAARPAFARAGQKVTAVTVNGAAGQVGIAARLRLQRSAGFRSADEQSRRPSRLTCEDPLPQFAGRGDGDQCRRKADPRSATRQILEPAAPPTVAGYHLVESLVQVGDAPSDGCSRSK